jgi:hypothetical protein
MIMICCFVNVANTCRKLDMKMCGTIEDQVKTHTIASSVRHVLHATHAPAHSTLFLVEREGKVFCLSAHLIQAICQCAGILHLQRGSVGAAEEIVAILEKGVHVQSDEVATQGTPNVHGRHRNAFVDGHQHTVLHPSVAHTHSM